jgi:cell division septation protein DedD
MFRRRKKLYFQNTVSKFPVIIFVASIIVGGFFLFKIISTLVRESENTAELTLIETKTEVQKKTEVVTPSPKEVVQKPAESSKTLVKTPIEKPAVINVADKQVKIPTVSEFYTIQVATFSDMRRTENLADQLKENKFSPVYIKTRNKLFEVCVGKFSNPQEGHEVLLQIKKDFKDLQDAFIRRIQPPFEEK